MRFFDDLGARVELCWKEKNYDEGRFPKIAAEALIEQPPFKEVDPWDVIRWLHTTNRLPSQQDVASTFGDPPITVFCGPRFYIDVYFWLDGTTSVHQHGFSGAFQVLLGSSIHSQFTFENKRDINAHFATGNLSLDSVELLEQGDTRQILPGGQFIHSLFHLDRPSATVTVRTAQTPNASPQYDYRNPYFAIDPFYREQSSIRKVQSALLLLSMQHPEADELIGDLISRSDFQTAYSILETTYHHLVDNPLEKVFGLSMGEERFQVLLERARRKFGRLADRIPVVLEESRRKTNIVNRRAQITGSEHRFFLALLLNVPHRAQVLDLVKQRFPGADPIDMITEWVEELATTKLMGGTEANVLGIDDFDDDYLFVFRCLLQGLSLRQTKAAFIREHSVENRQDLETRLAKLYDSLRQSMLFRSIFSEKFSQQKSARRRR